jgi:hypothetical protein
MIITPHLHRSRLDDHPIDIVPAVMFIILTRRADDVMIVISSRAPHLIAVSLARHRSIVLAQAAATASSGGMWSRAGDRADPPDDAVCDA